MESIEIPIKLINEKLLPHLEWNDLLRLRGVNKALKSIVDKFVIHQKDGIPTVVRIEVNETTRRWDDIGLFLNLGFKAANFHFHNTSGSKFFQHSALPIFVEKFCNHITHLSVYKFSTPCSGEEREFYESLNNLVSLHIKYAVKQPLMSMEKSYANGQCHFMNPDIVLPARFSQLKSLKIRRKHYFEWKNNQISADLMFHLCDIIMEKCLDLEEIAFGVPLAYMHVPQTIAHFLTIKKILERRERMFPGKPNLKICDLQFFAGINRISSSEICQTFLDLCNIFSLCGTKVKNVPACLFKTFVTELNQPEVISNVVLSLVDLHPKVLSVQMPYLNKIVVDTFFHNSFLSDCLPIYSSLPSLEKLELRIGNASLSSCKRGNVRFPSMSILEFYDLFFGVRHTRQSLKSLKIEFYKPLFFRSLFWVPCPMADDIVTSCPNITSMVISNWPGDDNIQISKLWSGLQFLEQLSFGNCRKLGDQSFIGADKTQPTFLQLNRLKKFYLRDLDEMPGITDWSFFLVFRHLKLEEFMIFGWNNAKNVTQEALSWLVSDKVKVFRANKRYCFPRSKSCPRIK